MWDRLFGTFLEEDAEAAAPVFGLDARRKPLGTHRPLVHQLHHFAATLRLAAATRAPLAALCTREPGPGMIMPPLWKARRGEPAALGPRGEADGRGRAPCDVDVGWVDAYAWLQFALVGLGLLWAMGAGRARGGAALAAGAGWLALSVVSFGQLLDTSGARAAGKAWAGWAAAERLEILRLALLGAGAALVVGDGAALSLAAAALASLGLFGAVMLLERRRRLAA